MRRIVEFVELRTHLEAVLLRVRVELLLVLHRHLAHGAHVALDDLAVRQLVLRQDRHRRENLQPWQHLTTILWNRADRWSVHYMFMNKVSTADSCSRAEPLSGTHEVQDNSLTSIAIDV